jgi:CHAT domain-containing protein/tetratricopeptide (TPR) repeat protein
MIRKILLFSAFIFPAVLYGQRIELVRSIDSLIVDSQFLKVLSIVDHHLPEYSAEGDKVILENKKSEALISLGRLVEAGALLDAISEQCTNKFLPPFYLAITLTNKGFMYLNKGRNDLAEEELSESLRQFERGGAQNSPEAARSYNFLGLVYMNTGKYNQAEEQMLHALAIRKAQTDIYRELIAASYNDLGLVYSQIDNDKAIQSYNLALNLYKEIHGESHPKIAIVNTNLAIIFRNLGRYNEAISNFESALKIWEGIYSRSHATKAFLIYNIGQTYMKMGAFNLASENFDKALSMYQEVYSEKHPEIASVLNAMGNLKISQGLFEEALGYYQSALKANVSNFDHNELSKNPSARNYFNGNVMLYSLLFKAQALEMRYYRKTIKLNDLKLALNTLLLCDSVIEQLRQRSVNQSDKISLGVISSDVYADGVRIANAIALNDIFKNYYLGRAFFFAEKSKGAVLQEAISDTDAKTFARVPSDLLDKERDLKSALANITQKIAVMSDDKEMQQLRETAFNLNNQYVLFIKDLEKKYPEYFNLKFNSATPSVSQIQELLDDQTAIISYFIDANNNRLYIFRISQKNLILFDKPLPTDFDRQITGFRNSIYYDEESSVKETGSSLYRILVPRLPNQIKNLIIIPADRLSILPFESLIARDDQKPGFNQTQFLLNRYSIRYEFSAGLILQKSRSVANKSTSIFLCAPITFPVSDHLTDLPGTQAEVNDIYKLFSDKHLTASIFTGQNANEKEIKSGDLKNYSFLHLATHGVVDEKNPELSRVYLQPAIPIEDGKLYAGEIYNLDLNADLVTLSACKTGLGKITRGEGVIGLSRALIYAGARNIIVSFWSVSDVSTAQLMKDFYRMQLENPHTDFSENLRLAKLNLFNTGKYNAPYYWAPFILIGY